MPSANLCQFCAGTCCRHYRDITLTGGDLRGLAQHLGIAFAKAITQFARPSSNGPVLRKREDGWCLFAKDGKCSVYESRPEVCRNFMPPECLDDKVARRQTGVDLKALRAELKRVRHATR